MAAISPNQFEVRLFSFNVANSPRPAFQFRDELELQMPNGTYACIPFVVDTFEQFSVISSVMAQRIGLTLPPARDPFRDISFSFAGFRLRFPCVCRFAYPPQKVKRFRLALQDIMP